MSIYGNIFKPVTPEDVNQLVEAAEVEVIQEATELGLYTEAKFHLFKVGDSKEYKEINKDLQDAEQILNANGEDIDVNKVGTALLHGTDAVVSAINAGSSAASIVNPVFIPVALGAKLVSVATKSGKEAEALKYAAEAISKLEDIKAGTEDEALIERINGVIEKLQKSKHTLEVGKKAVKKEEKAVKKEEKAAEKAEKKEAKAEKKALKAAAKAVKRNKATDDDNEDDDEEVISQVESSNLMEEFVNFCSKEGIDLSENTTSIVSNILEGGCDKGECDKKDDDEDVDENDREEVNEKIAEELTTKKESAIYTAFRALMAEATDEQIESFLNNMNEATAAQVAAMKNNPEAVAKFNKGLAKKMGKDAEAQNKAANDMEKVADVIENDPDNFGAGFSAGFNAAKSGAKAIKSSIKTDKAIENTIDKDEKAAYKENEKIESAAEKAKANQEKREAKAAAKAEKAAAKNAKVAAATESVDVEDLFNFVMENDVEITEDLYNTFVEVGLLEAAEPEFESYEEYVNYCLENGIQKTKEELAAIKESFIKDAIQKKKDQEVKFEGPKKVSPELAEKLKAAPKMTMEELENGKLPSESEMLAQAKKEGKIYVS